MRRRIPKHPKPHKRTVKGTTRPKRRAGGKWEQDPPPLITIKELAALASVSDDTIRNMMKEPNAPRVIGTKFPREPWLQYIQIRQLYGPKVLRMMTPEEVHEATTGAVTPLPAETRHGAPTPAPIVTDESGNVISATELLRLNPGELIKRKMAEELITRRLANQERKRRLIPRAEVEEWFWSRVQSAIAYKRQICLELPQMLIGLERAEIEIRMRDALDELFRRIAALGEPIKPAPGPAAAPTDPAPPSPAPPDAKTQSSGS